MRVLLVTWTDQLLEKLSILNPELEYCAIVVDEVEPAKDILKRVGLPASLLYPLYDLKECVRDFFYDYVLCVETNTYDSKITDIVQNYDVPKEKLLNLAALLSVQNFKTEQVLRYYKEHAAEIEIFATGISYAEVGLDATQFKRKFFNLAKSSQDLYYDFQIAKRVVSYGGGHSRLKYALISLAPYSFHYDLSNAFGYRYLLIQYLIALNDLHNFFIPIDTYRKFFRKEYLATRIPLKYLNPNNPYDVIPQQIRYMSSVSRLTARNTIDGWAKKNYPETRDENVKILDDYLTLCEENHIRPIIFLPPMTEGYKKHFHKYKINEFYYLVEQACKRHPSTVFIDGWKITGLQDTDFYDVFHLNIQGAAKFSSFLNGIIEQLDAQGG